MKDGIKDDFRIIRLAEGDVRCATDHIRDFRELVLSNERMYPGIASWYKNKVLSGIRNSERVAFIGYFGDVPAVSAVVRKGTNAKICHLRVNEDLRDSHLGEVFFSLMALEIRDLAKEVHFTLPESLWNERGLFFKSFGFQEAELSEAQYRLFDRELECSTSFATLWDSVLTKIVKLSDLYSFGGYSPDNQLLLSVKPEYADRILSRKKTVEIRRRFSTKWLGHRINLYASSPVTSLIGEATIVGVVCDRPEAIWDRFHDRIGCARSEFEQYCKGADQVYALELDGVNPYRDRIPLAQMSRLVKENLIPPQSHFTLEKGKPWAKAVSIAAYLHATFRSTLSFALGLGSDLKQRKVSGNTPETTPSIQNEFTWK